MDRRHFLGLCATALASTSALNLDLSAQVVRKTTVKPLNVKKIRIECGAEKPFSALQISDTHLTRVDTRDIQRKIDLAASRASYFPLADHYLEEAITYARMRNLLLLHSGDFEDFVSEANLDNAAARFCQDDWIVCCGNHEFSKFVGEAKEDDAYKADSMEKVQGAYPNDLNFYSRIVNGVNIVTLDDVYYNFTEEQHALMEKEMEKGLPVVMMCHVPLYTPKFCQEILKGNNGRAAYMTGAPLEITSTFEQDPSRPESEQWRNRTVQQRADKTTLDFISWLKEQKLLKGILAGHCHCFNEERFSETAMQYVVGANYNGDAQEVEFV